MPRPLTRLFVTRLFVASWTVVVVSTAACGSDTNNDQADTSTIVSPQPVEAAAEQSDNNQTTTRSDAALNTEDTSATAAQPTTAVRLGNRFEWCAQVQAVWDDHTTAFTAEAEAADAVSAALDARTAATDELDRAEAADALEDAQGRYRDARELTDARAHAAIEPLLQSANVDEGDDEPRDIAYRRAWEAFVSEATSAEVALMQLPDSFWVLHDLPDIAHAEAAALFSSSPVVAAEQPMAEPVEAGEVQSNSEGAEPLSEASLKEAAAAASNAAAEFSAQAVSFSDEAIATRTALRDALVAARDARDAAAVPDAASAAVASMQLYFDITVAVEASYLAAANAAHATGVARRTLKNADAAGLAVDPGFLDRAIASQSAAEAAQARIRDEIGSSFRDYWNLDEQDPRQALGLVRGAAYDAVLLHSTAHLAFARSLGESCQ